MAMKVKSTLNHFAHAHRPVLIYALVTLLVLLPLLPSGFILTMDMIFVPELQLPEAIGSSYPLRALLAILDKVLPADVIQKLLLFGIMMLMGTGAHRLTDSLANPKEKAAAYLTGALYMINPYTYSRFMAGQYSVLFGYALLPFFVRALLDFLKKPGRGTTSMLALWVVLISIVSIHTLGLVAIMTLLGLCLSVWRQRRDKTYIRQLATHVLISMVLILTACAYWLVPLVAGNGQAAEAIGRYGSGDIHAFQTVGGNAIGQAGNVIRLQGFWAEARGLYVLPQERLPSWGLTVLILWILVIVGGVSFWRRGHKAEVALLGIGAITSVALSIGTASRWLSEHLPFFSGYREPHKFVGLVALAYAVCAGPGAITVWRRLGNRFGETVASAMAGLSMALPLALTPTMFWGFNGQLAPRQYPTDWFVVNEQLNQDAADFSTLFLPWHQYMPFRFTDMTIIANPAEKFFDKPVLISDDPEFEGASPATSDPDIRRIGRLLDEQTYPAGMARQLTGLNIKYVILAKESDYDNYNYLDTGPGLRLMYEGDTLKLYRNTTWEKK